MEAKCASRGAASRLVQQVARHSTARAFYGPRCSLLVGERTGLFLVSSAYSQLRNTPGASCAEHWQIIWKLNVPERGRSFAWKIMHGKLPTKVYCSKWSGESSNCYYCASVDETIIRVLRDYPLAVSVWRSLVPQTTRSNFLPILLISGQGTIYLKGRCQSGQAYGPRLVSILGVEE